MKAKTGSNKLKVADIIGAGEETLHVPHLKPYLRSREGETQKTKTTPDLRGMQAKIQR